MWPPTPPISFRTVPVKQGDLVALVSATGTLEPEEVVDVGSQVNGPIVSLGKDPKDPSKSIDYDSQVEVGTLLAKVDDSVYKAQYDQAKANLLHAQADLGELQAHLDQCEAEWKRAEALLPSKAIADTDYDLDVANYKAAQANLEVGKATVKQCEAALAMAKRNLDYCTINSPVKGVIIDRRVNVGQTVVSNMSVSSVFLIAKDLRRMQVWASVNEADIGRIHEKMPVTFTVDAYPNEVFHGTVYQIRMNATMTQNVVTYTVVVETDNSDLRLLPVPDGEREFPGRAAPQRAEGPQRGLALEAAAANGGPGVPRQPGIGRQTEGRRQARRGRQVAGRDRRQGRRGGGQDAQRSEGRRRAETRQAAGRTEGPQCPEGSQGRGRPEEAQEPLRARPGLGQRRIAGPARQGADRRQRRHRHRDLRSGDQGRHGSDRRRVDPGPGGRYEQPLRPQTVQ